MRRAGVALLAVGLVLAIWATILAADGGATHDPREYDRGRFGGI